MMVMNDHETSIVLIGFMGTGKSTVGQQLAQHLGYEFIDLDAEIVRRQGRTIPELFAQDGEAYFRLQENRILTDLLQHKTRLVIATGGGAVLDDNNCKTMLHNGFVVALTAQLDTIVARVQGDTNRPLLQGDVTERVHALMEARLGRYDFAHCTVETDYLAVEPIIAAIMSAYAKHSLR
ncbi:shikimate kinase [Paenibacillus sp. UMB4589-SE434]|uniref:shikimate kinase n=1 Tax=Paenibacillus sp. UMB4589-SE434 TaxID=3046314 RepID=UPI00254A7D43|nr:shikimate kinase [Paenibacillus sp. UMB4589-SE434]MDK8180882.1 shikimate kinase [Paenibacillus sp. UMB4589-SE434]